VNEGALGSATYEEHVRLFCETVDPDVLSMDHYPIFHPTGDGRDLYCANLAVMRKYALKRGIPFWNFFNIMPYGPPTDPTEAQVRWQIFTSITYGATGGARGTGTRPGASTSGCRAWGRYSCA